MGWRGKEDDVAEAGGVGSGALKWLVFVAVARRERVARAGVTVGPNGSTAVGIGSKEIFVFVKFERPVKAASDASPERGALEMRAR